jgi:D-beta-D-heptose 7-phosphate kinase / D-beta-D-heptose 1-phosphate adenosyltransferase
VNGSVEILSSWEELRVLVIGDAMLDGYLTGTATRLCQEAPVPIVDVLHSVEVPGGAANVAANAAALGARTTLLSVVGEDSDAASLTGALDAAGVVTHAVLRSPDRATLSRRRVTSDGQLVARIDTGSTSPLPPRAEAVVTTELASSWDEADAVVVSDYGYGVLSGAVVAALASLQARSPRVIAVDAKDLRAYRIVRPTAVKPNFRQMCDLLGRVAVTGGARAGAVYEAGDALLDATAAQIAAVTLDRDGAVVVERDRPAHRTFAASAADARAAGAGDTYVSALAMGLACGVHTPAAAELAAAAAGVVVSRAGTATCSAAELRAVLSLNSAKCVANAEALERALRAERSKGRRVVLTNGCFDILHRGHITYLNRAKSLGDVLVVGVNTDASVARLKGPGRPINGVEDRMEVLAALGSVDYVVSFAEDTPERLVEVVRPDVFVKGGDYAIDMLPEAAVVESNGGVVRILDYVGDTSTTGILERIRSAGPSRAAG